MRLTQDLDVAVAVKGPGAAEELVEDDPEGEDVGAAVDGLEIAAGLFGREVAGSAHDLAGDGEPGEFFDPGDPEIEDIGVEVIGVVGDEDVGRFEITVDEPRRVGRLDGLGDLPDEERPSVRGSAPAPRHRAVRRRRTPWR